MSILLPTLVIGLLVFHTLERVLPPILPGYRTGPLRQGYLTDLTSALVNGPGLSGLTKLAAYGALQLVPAWGHTFSGWSWGAQFALFFIVDDFCRYWLHRWYHKFEWLWRIHRVHHTVTEMDSVSLLRIHVLEGAAKNFFIALPFQTLGLDSTVIAVYLAFDLIKGFWHHANFKTYIGPLNYLFVSAELHWWHHAADGPGSRSNYGSKISLWDWLFGTAYWPRGQWPDVIGVREMEHFSHDYIRQFCSIWFDDRSLIERIRWRVAGVRSGDGPADSVAIAAPVNDVTDPGRATPSAYGSTAAPPSTTSV